MLSGKGKNDSVKYIIKNAINNKNRSTIILRIQRNEDKEIYTKRLGIENNHISNK